MKLALKYILALLIVIGVLVVATRGIERFSFYNIPTPDSETSIGGRKGTAFFHDEGLYGGQRQFLAHGGTPNSLRNPRTLIDPSQVGFSYNSIVNRNAYADLFNNKGERRKNPNFKFVTKFKELLLNPARYALPTYSFATI